MRQPFQRNEVVPRTPWRRPLRRISDPLFSEVLFSGGRDGSGYAVVISSNVLPAEQLSPGDTKDVHVWRAGLCRANAFC